MELWRDRTSGVTLTLNKTEEFVQCMLDHNAYTIKRVQILPEEMVYEFNKSLCKPYTGISFVNDTNSGIYEVIVSSKTVKEIFLESYQYMYKTKRDETNKDRVRAATFGLLFVTATDTTALNENLECIDYKHCGKTILLENYFLLAGYLTCNYDKTNKSSCLWDYFKKLYGALIKTLDRGDDIDETMDSLKGRNLQFWELQGTSTMLLLFSVRTCLHSIKNHPRNYYASSALSFFLATAGRHTIKILSIILDFIETEFNDLSIWNAMFSSLYDLKYDRMEYFKKSLSKYTNSTTDIFGKCNVDHVAMQNLYKRMERFIFEHGTRENISQMYNLNELVHINKNLKLQMQDCVETFENDQNGKIMPKKVFISNVSGLALSFQKNALLKAKFEVAYGMKATLNGKYWIIKQDASQADIV